MLANKKNSLADANNNSNIKKNLQNSIVATAIAEFATLPICTIKTHYQTGNYNGMKETFHFIKNKFGIRGFYRASLPAVLSQTFSTATKYTTYRYICDHFEGNKFVNNTIACIIISLFTHPMDCIKINMQLGVHGIVRLIQQDKLRFFYRGYSKTLAKTSVTAPLFFPLCELVNEYVQHKVVSSLITSIIAATVMQPLDYLKTINMAGNTLWQGWHPKIYFRGLSMNLCRIVPHFVIVMSVIDYMNQINI